MITLQEFLNFYNEEFKPVYADLVAYLADKPINIIIEQENAFSHLTVYLDENQNEEIRQNNLEKANNHIVRATLDAYKLLWAELMKEINSIWENEDKRLSISISLAEFAKKREEFIEKSKKARKIEITSIGISPIEALNYYKEAIDIGWELVKSIDPHREIAVEKYKFKFFKKERVYSFLIGIVSGIIATLLIQLGYVIIHK